MYRIKPYYNRNVGKSVFDLFDDFFDNSREISRNFKVDVKELKDKYIVQAELPGFTKEDINITFENDYLSINLNKEESVEEDTKYVYKERYSFTSNRKLYLADVDPTKLGAKLEKGILEITLNKLETSINSYMIDID